jgi:hypothetical protein
MVKVTDAFKDSLTLEDDGIGGYELLVRNIGVKNPVLVMRIQDASNGQGETVIFNDANIRQLMDWLNRNYNPQE